MDAKEHAPILRVVTISSTTGTVVNFAPDVSIPAPNGSAHGLLLTNTNTLPNQDPVGDFMAERVWNSVWNDYADFQFLGEKEFIPGKVYYDTIEGARLCHERCQLAVMGIASDTFAHIVGTNPEENQVPIAVAGWVLAYVDQEYPCGTPLTNDKDGNLTEMTLQEKRDFPERMVATYKKKELKDNFGTRTKQISVNGRHWVKVK